MTKQQKLEPQKSKFLVAKTDKQKTYIKLIKSKTIIFALGQAGTGKTRVACSIAIEELLAGKVERIILTRPVLEAGESLGFLPGDLSEKIDPYMQPIYNEFKESIDKKDLDNYLNPQNKQIEIVPLAFMRGRTFKNAIVIADEMQGATYPQIKNLLTRLGEGSRLLINGDITQSDLPYHQQGALEDIVGVLEDLDEVGVVEFSREDIVRHPLIGKILDKLEILEKENNKPPKGYTG